jgi:hypothetical protein
MYFYLNIFMNDVASKTFICVQLLPKLICKCAVILIGVCVRTFYW